MANSYVRGTRPVEAHRNQHTVGRVTPHPVCTADPARRHMKGAYLCWLYRTHAWHVSFDEWQADRLANMDPLSA